MDMIGKVRRMKMRDGVSISEISRKTGLSRNTVKKWLKAPAAIEPRYQRVQKVGKLSAFEATLVAALKTDAHRARDQRRTARALFVQIQAQGYRGGCSTGSTTSSWCSASPARRGTGRRLPTCPDRWRNCVMP